jgi:hypothetical protein
MATDSRKTLTTESGAPVADNQNSRTAGSNGPVLIEDNHLIEKLAHFDRERIPERVVHAKGSGAFGYFEVTADVSRWTRAKFLQPGSKRTEVFIRFSTVAGEKGSADTVRDPRGFATKFYTEDGNYDLVGNDTPIFSFAIRSSSPTSSTPRSVTHTPTSRSRITSGISSRSAPRPPISSPGCSATAASRPLIGTWTVSARTPINGSTPRARSSGSSIISRPTRASSA